MNDSIDLELYNEEEWINRMMKEFDDWWNYFMSFFVEEDDDDDFNDMNKISGDNFEAYQNQEEDEYNDPYNTSNQNPIN